MKIPVIGVPIVNGTHWIHRLISSIDYPVEILFIINNNGKGEINEEFDNILYCQGSQGTPKGGKGIKGYEIDSNQRLIMKNGAKAKLTEKELELILALNKNNGLDKSFLLKNIWNHNLDLESHAFETHLHRLRKKINNIFKDNKFVVEKNSKYYLLTK